MNKEYHLTQFGKDVKTLVQIPSVSGNETAAQEHVLGQMQTFGEKLPGFSAWLQPVEGYQSPNLVACKKGNNGQGSKKAVILTGHIDTVSPAGLTQEWTGENPWSGEVVEKEDGAHSLHGLGVSDMKMGLTVLQYTFMQLAQMSSLDCDVWFVSAINEEINGAGTEAFAKWWQMQGLTQEYPEGLAAIFGEPRNMGGGHVVLGNGNKANDFLVAQKTTGSHHSSEEGENVIVDIAQLVSQLETLNATWQTEPYEEGFTPPHITATKIETPNNNLNSTPASGLVKLDLRTTPQTQTISLQQVITAAEALGFEVTHAANPAPGAYTSPDAPMVKAFTEVLLQEGVEVSLATTPGSTDAGFLQAVGISETVMAGAGLEEQEHHVDEYAILEDGERAIGLTVQAILKWLEMVGGEKNE